jgi:hypothetical protein
VTLPVPELVGCPRLTHLIGTPSLSHSTARSPSSGRSVTSNVVSPLPSFFATAGKTTSSQSAPLGGVQLFSGGTKCAATPSLLPGADDGEVTIPWVTERDPVSGDGWPEDSEDRATAEVTARALRLVPIRRVEGWPSPTVWVVAERGSLETCVPLVTNSDDILPAIPPSEPEDVAESCRSICDPSPFTRSRFDDVDPYLNPDPKAGPCFIVSALFLFPISSTTSLATAVRSKLPKDSISCPRSAIRSASSGYIKNGGSSFLMYASGAIPTGSSEESRVCGADEPALVDEVDNGGSDGGCGSG